MSPQSENPSEFEQEAEFGRSGLITEFWHFLRYNKKWWLVPILLVMLLLGGLIAMSGTAAAPFIYTLF